MQIVSAIQIYEVFGVLRRDLSEEHAVDGVASMHRARVIPVDVSLALEAADLALAHRLAMADALIYSTARHHGAQLITAQAGFEGLPEVVLIR